MNAPCAFEYIFVTRWRRGEDSIVYVHVTQVEGVKELGNEEVRSNEVPMARHSQAKGSQCSSSSGE